MATKPTETPMTKKQFVKLLSKQERLRKKLAKNMLQLDEVNKEIVAAADWLKSLAK